MATLRELVILRGEQPCLAYSSLFRASPALWSSRDEPLPARAPLVCAQPKAFGFPESSKCQVRGSQISMLMIVPLFLIHTSCFAGIGTTSDNTMAGFLESSGVKDSARSRPTGGWSQIGKGHSFQT